MTETEQLTDLYARYIQGLKRLSGKERDEITALLLEYKKSGERKA